MGSGLVLFGAGSGWDAAGLVVEGELADEGSGGGLDDFDVQVGDLGVGRSTVARAVALVAAAEVRAGGRDRFARLRSLVDTLARIPQSV